MNKLIKLNRFTTLPVALDLLHRQKLVLLDPVSWDDKNDTEIILEYKRKAKIKSLFALCFTHNSETIHHWKTFANGPSGCCIEFSARKLTEIFKKVKGLRHGLVNYHSIQEAGRLPFKLSEIPFIKRKPYQFEREYRVIWEGNSEAAYQEIDLPLTVINRITFSQQMPEPVFESVKELLVTNYAALKNKISHSTIYLNKNWVNHFKD